MTSRDASAYLPPAPFGGAVARLDAETYEAFARADAELALDTVGEAVRLMATNDLPLRARLVSALVHLQGLRESDFPPSTRSSFRALDARSSWAASKAGGDVVRAIGATVGVVSEGECVQLAALLCDLHAAIVRAFVATSAEVA